MNETLPYIAIIFSGVTLLVLVGEKLFGGGNALANKFHKLETDTTRDISALRAALQDRIDQYEDNYSLGIEAIKANIHALQMGLLEFRAKMAEEYVRTGGLDDIKADMRRGFEAVDKRMGELQDMIMWAQPPQHGGGEPNIRRPQPR